MILLETEKHSSLLLMVVTGAPSPWKQHGSPRPPFRSPHERIILSFPTSGKQAAFFYVPLWMPIQRSSKRRLGWVSRSSFVFLTNLLVARCKWHLGNRNDHLVWRSVLGIGRRRCKESQRTFHFRCGKHWGLQGLPHFLPDRVRSAHSCGTRIPLLFSICYLIMLFILFYTI